MKKKKLLFIIGNYNIPSSSVSNQTNQYIYELKDSYKIDVITNRTFNSQKEHEIIEDLNVYRVNDWKRLFISKINNSNLYMILKRIILFFFYIFFRFMRYDEGDSGWSKKKTMKLFERLNSKEQYECIISVSEPFQAHIISSHIKRKHRSMKLCTLFYDSFAYNRNKRGKLIRKQMRKYKEISVSKISDKILLTPELKKNYQDKGFLNCNEKIFIEDYYISKKYMLSKINKEKKYDNYNKKNKVNVFFGGNFYKKIREPNYIVKLFAEFRDKVNLLLFTSYNKNAIILKDDYNDFINVMEIQTTDVYYYTLFNTDVLLSVGNTNLDQIPGKTFEYLEVNKPIIHFSFNDKDPVIQHLYNYDNHVIINVFDEHTVNMSKLKVFLDNLSNNHKINRNKISKKEFNLFKILEEENYE